MTRPVGIDLFAGAGGMSLGFEQAGFDVVAAVEIDPIHAAVHAYNFPHCKVISRSVVGLEAGEIRRAAGLGHRKVDVVFGGAPCQGFSLIGQRAIDDPRNALVKEFVRLVVELDASYFVFENVKGLTVGRHVEILFDMIAEFAARGYDVVQPWRILNAACFGVPQNRERLFLMGAKRGQSLPGYPDQITRPAGSLKASALPEGPSCHDALSDIPDAEKYRVLLASDSCKVSWGSPSTYAMGLRGLTNDANGLGYGRHWDAGQLTSSLRTDHTELSRRRFAQTPGGEVEPISRFYRLPRGGVANTLRAGTDSARGAFTSPRPIHYKYPRCVTVREMMRLHGYPDWFRMHATKWHGARQVGNSVPPPLAQAVASMVVAASGFNPTVPHQVVTLGDPRLLTMEMTEAASFFGIAVPIKQRTRKVTSRSLPPSDEQSSIAAE
ncbi:DNA (cytosine-5-)-methyltransferase [Mesorhizobium sp. WSM1497]|uniref:DNA cytosine methyltransferase n=1 Tax=Mesorhizobium sp. WSM1497 TaxID=278153 RepID=UPI0007EE0F32|nr:DNA cytosine methyltransferase [Mesorhizobium sp. WSM1497]ARP62592.1 DNA (cytosine-5-)-methyltransferase [Mesorhizobium sp. WSM1497]